MRKILNIHLLLGILLFASCERKDQEVQLEQKEKTYKLNLSVISHNTISGVLETSTPKQLKDLINQLTIIVYESNGEEYVRRTQLSTELSFGTIDLNLPVRNYTVVVVGSKSPFYINLFYKNATTQDSYLPLSSANFQYKQLDPSPGQSWYKTDDTFFAKKALTVDAPDNVNITLERIVGRLELIVEDCDDYYAIVTNDATAFMFNSETSYAGIQNDHWTRVNDGTKTYRGYILRTDKPLNLEIKGCGIYKEIPVSIYKNRVTLLRGKLSAPLGVPAFDVSINDTWSIDTAKICF